MKLVSKTNSYTFPPQPDLVPVQKNFTSFQYGLGTNEALWSEDPKPSQ